MSNEAPVDDVDARVERRQLRDRVIEAALVHAAFDGWTRKSLVAAGADGFHAAFQTDHCCR